MTLENFISGLPTLGRATPASKFAETRDSIVGMFIIKNGDFAYDWDAAYTWPADYKKIGASVASTGNEPITGKNIIDVARSLTLRSKGWFFPHGTMGGSKPMGTPTKKQMKYGIFPVQGETGVITETATLNISGMHLNIEFWNSLRTASSGYTVLLFLNNAVIWVKPENTAQFHDIGVPIGGDSANSVTGGSAQLSYQSVGEIVWKEGVTFSHLDEPNFMFTFAAATPTGLSAATCTYGNLRFTGVAADGGSFTKPINEAAYSDCVVYSGSILSGPGSTGITINASTGAVTVAPGITAGTYKYRVIAQNNTSVYGVYDVTFVLS